MTNSAVNEAGSHYQLSTVNSQFANEVKQVPVGYKQTEVGVIPKEWDVQSGRQLFTKIQDGTHFSPKISGGGFLYVTSKNIRFGYLELNSAEYIDRDQHESIYKRCDVRKNDILLTKDGANTGNAALNILNEPFSLLSSVAFLRLDLNRHSPEYFLQQILSNEFQVYIQEEMSGNAITRLTLQKINNLKFYVPPKKEQTAIANALSDVDALIQELEKLIAKKQAIKTATMQQLLTGRTRLPQFALREDSTPKGTKQSELGEIPEDWEVAALRELLKESPKYGISAPAVPLEGKLPVYIRITDISEDGYFKPTEKVGVRSPFSDMYQLADGDIVLARTGASVGKSYLYRPEDGILVYAGFLIKVSPEQTKLKPKFLFQYLQTEGYWSWVTVNSMRSGQPGINGNEYSSLLIPCPRIEEQTTIVTILSDMDEEIQALEQRLSKTRQIKQGMMQELLTGKTRLIQRSEAV